MSPKSPLHISFYKLWMNRLQDCCALCGELHDDNPGSQSYSETTDTKQIHSEYLNHYSAVEVVDFPLVENLKEERTDLSDSLQIIWRPYHQSNTHNQMKKQRNRTPLMISTYHQKQISYLSSTFLQTIQPTTLRNIQLSQTTPRTQPTVEFIVDTTNNEDDDNDIFEDLLDAYKLEDSLKQLR